MTTGRRASFFVIDDPGYAAGPDLADAVTHLFGSNPYARPRSAGPAGASYVVEIITDPNDRRGIDARRVGPCR